MKDKRVHLERRGKRVLVDGHTSTVCGTVMRWLQAEPCPVEFIYENL